MNAKGGGGVGGLEDMGLTSGVSGMGVNSHKTYIGILETYEYSANFMQPHSAESTISSLILETGVRKKHPK